MCKLCDLNLINNNEYEINDDSTTTPLHLEYLRGKFIIRISEDEYDWSAFEVTFCPYCGRKLNAEELNGKE